MRVIAVYSGKGGVGKTTVASLLALAFAKKHKTVLVDLDLNTPSLPVIFKKGLRIKNLTVQSLGYKDVPMIMSGNYLSLYISNLVKKIGRLKPEICVLDMPPSIGEIHLEFCINFKPSSFLLVNQPNDLSKSDLMRSISLFSHLHVPIMGLIDNMVGDVFGSESAIKNVPSLLSIPLDREIAQLGNSGKLHTLKNNPLLPVADSIYGGLRPVSWERAGVESSALWGGLDQDEVRAIIYGKRDRKMTKSLRYMGLNSWDLIRRHIDCDPFGGDTFLEYNNADTIRRLLEAFNDNTESDAMFMVIRSPNTAIRLYPGEVGFGRLILDGRGYYGVPRIAYKTDDGEVHLFPHEVSHKDEEFVMEGVRCGELQKVLNSQAVRYVPTEDVLEQIEACYAERTGLNPEWRASHSKLVCA